MGVDLHSRAIKINALVCNAAVSACTTISHWQQSTLLLDLGVPGEQGATTLRLEWNAPTFCAAVEAADHGHQFLHSVDLVAELDVYLRSQLSAQDALRSQDYLAGIDRDNGL